MIRKASNPPPRKAWAKFICSSADEHAAREGCYFDEASAERVCEFFRKFLRHSSGEWAGKPFELLDYQRNDIVYPLYGWKRPDGTRRYRRGYVTIPKKNGKSTLCSGLSLYHLEADGEVGADVFCVATDRIQAGIVYDEAAHMVESSPALTHRLELVKSQKRIVDYQNRSVFRALAADAGRNEGLKTSFLIFDELHTQKNRTLWDSLRWGGAARRQPLMLAITTAGWDRNSICFEQYQYGKRILDGSHVDSSYFTYIAEAEEKDDWNDEAVWLKANPSLGHTITLDSFRADYLEAKQSAASENAFRRYRLNQWTEQDVRWLPMDKWTECGADYGEADYEGRECFAGLDLASTQDIAAFVLLFPNGDGSIDLLPYFWAPEGATKLRERLNRSPISAWIQAGHIRTNDGDEIDFDQVRADIVDLGRRFNIRKIAKDRWNSAQIGHQLAEEGFDVVDCPQGKWLSPAAKELYRRVCAGELRHNNNPVLNWMAGNVAVHIDAAENVTISKKKSTEKIDGIVSAAMAIALSIAEPQQQGIESAVWL